MGLKLVALDPNHFYPPHVLVTDEPDSLRLETDLAAGADLRFMLRDRPHAAVAYVLGSTYRERGDLRPSYYPLVAFPAIDGPSAEQLLLILNCCKWSERMLEADWEAEDGRYQIYGCRLTERYLLEFIYGVYEAGGFVIPGHLGDARNHGCSQPYHIDLAQGRILGLSPETVAEIRRRYSRDLGSAIVSMSPMERTDWGIPQNADSFEW